MLWVLRYPIEDSDQTETSHGERINLVSETMILFFRSLSTELRTHDMELHSPGEHRQFFSSMVAHGTDVVKAIALL